MLSKQKISLIKSLNIKKFRDKYGIFIAEGEKTVKEIINSDVNIKYLFISDKDLYNKLNSIEKFDNKIFLISNNEMQKISLLKNPSEILAVVEKPIQQDFDLQLLKEELIFAFEDLQNPGNLGTIIRTCDWFGIRNIILSNLSVDVYSPKVIQASMGSFLRVDIHYKNLEEIIHEYKRLTGNICYGTFLEGENIYNSNIDKYGLVVFGNEGQGISENIAKIIDKKLFIPQFSTTNTQSESLNVAVAMAIIGSEFRRR